MIVGVSSSPLEGALNRQETVRSDSCKLELEDRGCRRQLFAILVATKNVHLAFNRFESPFPRSLNTHSFRFKIRGLGGPSSWNLVRLVIWKIRVKMVVTTVIFIGWGIFPSQTFTNEFLMEHWMSSINKNDHFVLTSVGQRISETLILWSLSLNSKGCKVLSKS